MILLLGNCIYQTVRKIYDHSKITLCLRSLHEPHLKIINLLHSRPKENALNLWQNSQYLWKILLKCRHWLSSPVWHFCCWVIDVTPTKGPKQWGVRRGGCISRLQCIHCGILHGNPVKLYLQSIECAYYMDTSVSLHDQKDSYIVTVKITVIDKIIKFPFSLISFSYKP